jgi:preprotein translocase subunit YajC
MSHRILAPTRAANKVRTNTPAVYIARTRQQRLNVIHYEVYTSVQEVMKLVTGGGIVGKCQTVAYIEM